MKPLPFRVRETTDLEKWRVDTFWTKEPETIAWIDTFCERDRFLDIGANIGLYSLYAAKRGCQVTAVEPHYGNFVALIENTRKLNRGLPIWVVRGCVGHCSQLTTFCADTVEAGGGGCQSSGGSYLCDVPHGRLDPTYCYTVDELMNMRGGPYHHIKIDVDGAEREIVLGMKETLAQQAIVSCLIEVCPETKEYIVRQFQSSGYTQDNIFNRMTPHSRERRQEEGIDVENIVFTRLCRFVP